MYAFGHPEHELRMGHVRSVMTGALVERLAVEAHDGDSLNDLSDYVLDVFKRCDFEGDVRSQSLGFAPDNVEDHVDMLVNGMCDTLKGYGLLARDFRHKVKRSLQIMACEGCSAHVDAHSESWKGVLFWVYVLKADNVDLRFGNIDLSIPLEQGQFIVFDPGQPHAVVKRGKDSFAESDFRKGQDVQCFLGGQVPLTKSAWQGLGVETLRTKLRSDGLWNSEKVYVCERSGTVRMP